MFSICFVEHPPTFFCAKGKTKADYEPTRGDIVRNMTDRQLAVFMDEHEKDAYEHGKANARWNLGKSNIEWYTKYFGTSENEED